MNFIGLCDAAFTQMHYISALGVKKRHGELGMRGKTFPMCRRNTLLWQRGEALPQAIKGLSCYETRLLASAQTTCRLY